MLRRSWQFDAREYYGNITWFDHVTRLQTFTLKTLRKDAKNTTQCVLSVRSMCMMTCDTLYAICNSNDTTFKSTHWTLWKKLFISLCFRFCYCCCWLTKNYDEYNREKLELPELGIYFTCFYHSIWNIIIKTHVYIVCCCCFFSWFALLPHFNGQIAMFVTISMFVLRCFQMNFFFFCSVSL